MRTTHITLILNVHSESVVAGPTVRSAARAIEHAESHGFTVDRLLGIDRGTQAARQFFSNPAFDAWRYLELNAGDLGSARNSLVEAAKDGFIALLDGDDLFSENWLTAAAMRANEAISQGLKCVIHPELRWIFDEFNSVAVNLPSTHPLFLQKYLSFAHTYDSLVLGPRDTLLDSPYRERDRKAGFGYEDWAWTLDTLSKGVAHLVAKDTIIFKRRRDVSLLSDLAAKKTMIWPHDLTAINANTIRHRHPR